MLMSGNDVAISDLQKIVEDESVVDTSGFEAKADNNIVEYIKKHWR